jgi:hypothetical protein
MNETTVIPEWKKSMEAIQERISKTVMDDVACNSLNM